MSSGVFDLGLIPRGAWASKEPVGPVSLSRRDPVRKLNHYYGICRGNVSPVRVILIIPVELELKGRLRLIIISFQELLLLVSRDINAGLGLGVRFEATVIDFVSCT